MNKEENDETRRVVRWRMHAPCMTTCLYSLLEHQSLVDVAICCGTNTIHVHKCVLAANSQYFREQLEKNLDTKQIIMTGIDFTIIKSIIDYMYCGVTSILEKHLKYTIAAAKFFQLNGWRALMPKQQDVGYETDIIHIPPPVFSSKKPKYPNSCRPVDRIPPSENFNSVKNPIENDTYMQGKKKRKFVKSKAEKACGKVAAESRLELEALKRKIASKPDLSLFVIEKSGTETTVENFISHTEESYIENLDQIDNVPQLQVVNESGDNMMQFDTFPNSTKDTLQQILGTDLATDFRIMFQTIEEQFVKMTYDELLKLPDGTHQYQFGYEHGQLGEVCLLKILTLPNGVSSELATVTDFNDKSMDWEQPLLHIPAENHQKTFTAGVQKSNTNCAIPPSSSPLRDKTRSNVSAPCKSELDEADAFLDDIKSKQSFIFVCCDKTVYEYDVQPTNLLTDVDVDDVIDLTDM